MPIQALDSLDGLKAGRAGVGNVVPAPQCRPELTQARQGNLESGLSIGLLAKVFPEAPRITGDLGLLLPREKGLICHISVCNMGYVALERFPDMAVSTFTDLVTRHAILVIYYPDLSKKSLMKITTILSLMSLFQYATDLYSAFPQRGHLTGHTVCSFSCFP